MKLRLAVLVAVLAAGCHAFAVTPVDSDMAPKCVPGATVTDQWAEWCFVPVEVYPTVKPYAG